MNKFSLLFVFSVCTSCLLRGQEGISVEDFTSRNIFNEKSVSGINWMNDGNFYTALSDWRFYDTIYTERYLQTPQLNPDGYDLNSPSTYAQQLKGAFLLVHGTGDDNVHFQNSIVFADALIDAGVEFQSFYYPDKHHDIQGETTRHHLYTLMLDFIEKNL